MSRPSEFWCKVMEVQPMKAPLCLLFHMDLRFGAAMMNFDEMLDECVRGMAEGIARAVDAEVLKEVLEGLEDLYDSEPAPRLIDRERFPHSCPRCGSAAYVGLSDVDCSSGCV